MYFKKQPITSLLQVNTEVQFAVLVFLLEDVLSPPMFRYRCLIVILNRSALTNIGATASHFIVVAGPYILGQQKLIASYEIDRSISPGIIWYLIPFLLLLYVAVTN